MKSIISILSFIFAAAAFAQNEPFLREKELLITSPDVVTNSPQAQKGGSWHIRSALQRIAGPNADVDAFAESWFKQFEGNESLNGDKFDKRPGAAAGLRNAWKNDNIKLLAIVNRIDLTRFLDTQPNAAVTRLGEGRFVYGVSGGGSFTFIFEYGLPGRYQGAPDRTDLKNWATRWHSLGDKSLGGPADFGPDYLKALEAITNDFSGHGSLNQVRTNEISNGPWQLREFKFTRTTGKLEQAVVALTPRDSLDQSVELLTWINNADSISRLLDGTHQIPEIMLGGKSDQVNLPEWKTADLANDKRAGFIFRFNTCNGCHHDQTLTNGGFQHISGSGKSPFLSRKLTLDHALPGRDENDKDWDELSERGRLMMEWTGAPSFLSEGALRSALRARANRTH